MIKIETDNSGKTLAMQLIHPVTNNVILEGDGFENKEEVATFAADLYATVMDIIIPIEDVLAKLEKDNEST